MKSMVQHQDLCCRGDHRGRVLQACHAAALVALSAALCGACTLDTDPVSPVTRAPLQAETETAVQAPEDHLDVSTSHTGAAGAAADVPTPSAAILTASADAATVSPDSEEKAADEHAPAEAAPEESKAADKNAAPAKMPAEDKVAADTHDSRCKPGKYTGVINGTVNLTGLISVGTMAGTISLELVADQAHPSMLVVHNGRVVGLDDKESKFAADLTGKVDCVSGETVETTVERGSFEEPTLDAEVAFAGAAKGQYSMDPPALLGTWQISDPTTLLSGQGTWSATKLESD